MLANPDNWATKADDLIRQATKMGKTINNIDNIVDTARMFGRTNVDDIGMVDKGWERAVFDGVDRFRHKKITYPEEADDVRRALEATKGQHNLAYMGVKDGYIVIAYESDLERAWPAFNKAVSGMTDAARTTSRITNTAVDGTRMFGRTNVDDIGVYSKGWSAFPLEGYNKFKMKEISYPGEADDVRRALESSVPGKPNQAFLGVKDDYIIITYATDLDQMRPIFNRYVSGSSVDNVTEATVKIPAGKLGAADMWRHSSNPTRLYTTDEMADIIHRSGNSAGLTGWEPVETIGDIKTPTYNQAYTSPSNTSTSKKSIVDDLLAERRKAQQVSVQTPQTTATPQKSFLDIAREADEAGRARIDAFRAKYDMSTQGRLKYTEEQWKEIFDNEIGWSDLEDTFRDDFFRDYQSLLELNRY